MTNNFEQIRQSFKEEALDHINDLEKALLELEDGTSSKKPVEIIFRAMHSLKGGGGMFGYEQLSDFTHNLENIYDLIRRDQLKISGPLVSITLQSVDLLRVLLDEQQAGSAALAQTYQQLLNKVCAFVATEPTTIAPEVPKETTTKTWLIHFSPGTDVLQNGNNPLYLLDELSTLGATITLPGINKLPCLDDLQPTESYLYWDIVLATSQTEQDIHDVFIFVEATSQISITCLSNHNLLADQNFEEKLKKMAHSGSPLTAESIKAIIGENKVPATRHPNAHQPSLRVDAHKIDILMNLVSELVMSQDRLGHIASQNDIPELDVVANTIQKLTAQLRDSTFSISLLPISSLTVRFRRLVRDLSSTLGKEVVFTTSGEDTGIDKSMIESLSDPLLHIMRNSIDHGIETPQERIKAGKPPTGTISLKAFYSGANVIIEICDDGKGLNATEIRQKAMEKGIIDANARLSNPEIYELIFLPGFSTRETVSDLSGRGVGMDVVKKNIAAIRGSVKINATPGQGTCITIHLPMVLSIIDGLLVSIGTHKYVLPLSMVHQIFSVDKQAVQRAAFNNIITLEGAQYPWINLRHSLSIAGDVPHNMQAVLVSTNGPKVLLSVDRIEGKIQAVLKPLGRFYQNNPFLSAATILADGSIALVLDPNAIISEY
jgi:two-component system chemotaxis sensor kinase CheA